MLRQFAILLLAGCALQAQAKVDITEAALQKEVADMLGISQSYISRLEKRIIGRLKKEIAKMC